MVILSLSLFAADSFGYYRDRSNNKLLYGLVLSAAGLVLAFHGFSMAKEDISQPSVEIQNFSFNASQPRINLPYNVTATGQVRNTGNVDLTGHTVFVEYYDSGNNLCADIHEYYGGIRMNDTGSFSLLTTGYAINVQPVNYKVYTDLQYDSIYRTRQQNQAEGIIGVVVFGIGAYLMIDYALNINKFDTYMQKHDMDVKLAASRQSLGFLVSKKL